MENIFSHEVVTVTLAIALWALIIWNLIRVDLMNKHNED